MLVQQTFKNQLEEVEATEGKENERKMRKKWKKVKSAPKSTDDECQIYCGSLVPVARLSHPRIT